MYDYIKNLVEANPKRYSAIIASRTDLLDYVKQHSAAKSNHIPTLVYGLLSKENNICTNGVPRTVRRISQGYSGCGPAATCECTRNNIKKQVSISKNSVTLEKQQQINFSRSQTMLKKYGVSYNSQRLEIKHLWNKPKISQCAYSKLSDKLWLDNEYNIKQRSAVDIAEELKVYYGTVVDYCRKFDFSIRASSNYSLVEKQIAEYVESLGFEIVKNDRDRIGRELDVLVPTKNFAIEVNGLYWHSYHPNYKECEDKSRHLVKTQLCETQGIELLHITDQEWRDQQPIIKSMIKTKLGLNQTIAARKCYVATVDKATEKHFLETYHLQGYIPSSNCLGLYYQNQLISLMSVGSSRFSKMAETELLRYCTCDGITVTGGGSKLVTALLKLYPEIITYCDRSKSQGRGYGKMGFDFIKNTGPGYFYTDGNGVISRYRCQKNRLSVWLPSYQNHWSESQNMFAAGFRRFHDCGNKLFIIKNKNAR
jgi:hypothetical protein